MMLTPSLKACLLAIFAALALGACGTKGGLDCPPGTQEHVDGTCRPVGP